jgi:pimeloyl-ACP methyl ester carboxylesterase
MTRFIARSGHRLSMASSGAADGTAVVGLHDLLADRGQLRPLADALAERQVRLILPDARGHGASAAIAGRSYPTGELVADLLAILDAEAIEQTHVVASGWSAATALGLAVTAPQRVASLVIAAPYLPDLLTDHPDAAAREAGTTHLTTVQEAAVAADKGLTDRALDLYLGARLGAGWREAFSKARLGAIRRSAASLAPLLETLVSERIDRQALRRMRVPAVVLVEPDDAPIVRWTAEALAALLPQARVEHGALSENSGPPHSQDWLTEAAR